MENYLPFIFIAFSLLMVWQVLRRHSNIQQVRESIALQLKDVDKVVCRDVAVKSTFIGVAAAHVTWMRADVTFLENSMICFLRHRGWGSYRRALQLYRETPGEFQVLPGRFVFPIESVKVKGQDLIVRFTYRYGLPGRSTLTLRGVAAMRAVKNIWRLE